MRSALINENSDLCADYPRYVMRITGNDKEGIDQLDSFVDPEAKFPVIVTTSQLLSRNRCADLPGDCARPEIGSMTEFKQIVGRGTRIHEDTKEIHTLIDFGRRRTISPTQTSTASRSDLRAGGRTIQVAPPEDEVAGCLPRPG